jgi:hypothetical protein
MPRSPEPIDTRYPHGTVSAYREGCGCPPCKAAHRDADRAYRSAQLALFPASAGRRATPARPKVPAIPEGLDLDAVAAALADPWRYWPDSARCKERPDLLEVFHEEVPVAYRRDGTVAVCAPGDYTPAEYQAWCGACPVRADCVADAIRQEAANFRTGFYGSTPTQRGHIVAALRTRSKTA